MLQHVERRALAIAKREDNKKTALRALVDQRKERPVELYEIRWMAGRPSVVQTWAALILPVWLPAGEH